ncbi:CHY zinc finger-domain-containing protein [Gloeopeniophorella convolvens]|nr:CHY zinc finger-domain-containing protein [Gloeopeniophorella convolvens]
MCQHILNAQVSIRAPCCQQWFDCPECHAETQTHPLKRTLEMIFICKKCKKAFRKDMSVYEESDEYCPHCDNHYVIDAKTPQAAIGIEGEDARVDSRLIKDERAKSDPSRSLFVQDGSDRLG